MDKNHAIVEQDGHILIITLNRPEKRNALSPGMLITVYEAWKRSLLKLLTKKFLQILFMKMSYLLSSKTLIRRLQRIY